MKKMKYRISESSDDDGGGGGGGNSESVVKCLELTANICPTRVIKIISVRSGGGRLMGFPLLLLSTRKKGFFRGKQLNRFEHSVVSILILFLCWWWWWWCLMIQTEFRGRKESFRKPKCQLSQI